MTTHSQGRPRGLVAAGTALLATLATGATFLAPTTSPASAATATTTTPTTVPPRGPGYACSTSASGTELNRGGWVASTNTPSAAHDGPSNAVDGNLKTRFSSNEDQTVGMYFQVYLGPAQEFDSLGMFVPNSDGDYARGYDVEVSNDGSSWTVVAICSGTATPQIVTFAAQRARYVRVALTAPSSSNWWSIDEFYLYAAPSTASTTTTTTLKTSTISVSSSTNPVTIGDQVTLTAHVNPVPTGGGVSFFGNGVPISGCTNVGVSAVTGQALCTATYSSSGHVAVEAFYSGNGAVNPSNSGVLEQVVNLPDAGYWVVTTNGQVYGRGAAAELGNVATSSTTGPVVGIASTLNGRGYWVVTADGSVSSFGTAKFYGDIPMLGKHVSDIVAIAPTADGNGYYLVGADGGFFTFGDATFHGSLPGIHIHVHDIVGMVGSPSGAGYLLVGADGGVFTFGNSRFYGSLPGLGKHVTDIRAILPSSAGAGYVLVGADGGAFIFGSGVRFHGSLPGEAIKVTNIVGIALTPDDGGYYMAGSYGKVYSFGDAQVWPQPADLTSNLPVAAIAGT